MRGFPLRLDGRRGKASELWAQSSLCALGCTRTSPRRLRFSCDSLMRSGTTRLGRCLRSRRSPLGRAELVVQWLQACESCRCRASCCFCFLALCSVSERMVCDGERVLSFLALPQDEKTLPGGPHLGRRGHHDASGCAGSNEMWADFLPGQSLFL